MDARNTTPDGVMLAGHAVQGAIVDLDGTMIDTLGDLHAAMQRTMDVLGLPAVSREQVEHRIGKGSEYLVLQVLRIHLPDEQAQALYARALDTYLQQYAQLNGEFADPFPGVVEGVAALKAAGLRLACATNKPTGLARQLLQIKGLLQYFELVNGGDAFPRKKPDPMPLLETCKQLGLPPALVLMIGDSQNDALAARAAGCPVALVTYGYNHGEPIRTADADAFADRIGDLLPA
ncbi:phosphoglycolate phosphatase [Thiomonas bhubaneswarensis]|uniref:Phosphoglycolate phosphatase n=1 Tax=Thiomonas bhubaneswarensis TaxID=339866 RepID=A0A0K6IA50_9BURK|nr:phosphoglycolate phosphatase [Thiomonas bhubaneswarensis]CUA99994.1 2-phosphoglycolate phosphatase, prokaryotic [Thiomonas bhubaneswarensis]